MIPIIIFIYFIINKSSNILFNIFSGIRSFFCGILPGIFSGILFGILFGKSSGILSGKHSSILFGIPSDILSDILSGILAYLLTFYLVYLLAFYLIFYLVFYLVYLLLFYLVIEGQRYSLSSEGPRLRSSGIHWPRRVPGWGPAVLTVLGGSQVELGRSEVEVQRCPVPWDLYN